MESSMNAWKRPLCPDGTRLPIVCPSKKPRLACVNLPMKSFLSTTYDLSLHAFVSGHFLQDMLRYFTQNLLPLVSRSGVYLENIGHDRILQIINTFLLCEWSRGRVPLLCANMALTAVASDSEVFGPPQPYSDAAPGDIRLAASGEQSGNAVLSAFSPMSAEVRWSESQSVDVVKFVEEEEKGGGRDMETQTTEAQCCDQSVQTEVVSAALAGPQVVDSKDSCVQTEEALVPNADHSPASDRPQQDSVQSEKVGHEGIIRQPAEKVPGLQPPHSSQQTIDNLTQGTGIQSKDEHEHTMLQNRSPTQTAANGFLPVEGSEQNHVEESRDTHVDGERTQCGISLPTGETTLPGKTLPSEDATQHTDYPLQGRSIPSRITSGRGKDQALPRRESAHMQSGLNSVGNAECHVQMASGHPNPNLSPSNSQGTPQFHVNGPVNARYGVNMSPGAHNQLLANGMALPRNGPYPPNILRGPRPCAPSLNRIPVRQCPPSQLVTNQQGMNILPVGNPSVGQDSGLRPQGPPIHRTAAQPGMGQHLRSSDPCRSSNMHTSGNLIQLTGTPCILTARQVSSNVLNESIHEVSQATPAVPRGSQDSADCSTTTAAAAFSQVGTDWQCPPQNSAATVDSVAQRGMNMPVTPCGNQCADTGVQLQSSAVETGVQSFSSAVDSSLLTGSDKSGEKSSPSCAQQQMCNGDGQFPSSSGHKPMYDGGSQFSDTSSVLAQSSVDQTQRASTDCKEVIPGLPRRWNAAENGNQSRCPLHDASWKQVGIPTSGPRDSRLPEVTDRSTCGDQRVADMRESKPAAEWRQSPKEGQVSRAAIEQTGYIEALQRLLHEDMDTDSKQSAASSLQPASAPRDSVHMPPIDEIPLPDEEVKGLLPNSPEQDQNKLPVKQTSEKNNSHLASKVQPVDDMKQALQKFIDRVCKSASAQEKRSNTSGRIPSLHDIPLPDSKEQNSYKHSPPWNEKNDEVMKADSKVKSEDVKPSVGKINSPLTSVSPEPSHVGEQNEQKKEMKQTKREMLRALVDQIQTYVDQLSGAYSSPVKSPSQEKPVCVSQQAQDATTGNSLPKEQKVSKGLLPGSSRFAPYEVRNGKRFAERYTSSSQNSDVNTLIKTLVMNEIPTLMRSHGNLSAEAIEEQCARLISRYSFKALHKRGRMCRSTETDAVVKRSRGTMTWKPHCVSRRLMTNRLEVSDASTVTNIIGRRERSTLTDNRRVQDASTTARRLQPCISRSSQTAQLNVEAGTVTDTAPRPVTTQQGTETDSTERDKPAMTTALVATQRTTHLTVNQLFTNTAQLQEKPLEQCRALVPAMSDTVSRDNRGHQGEELAEASQPSEGEGTVRITIKVKVGKGSNIRLAS